MEKHAVVTMTGPLVESADFLHASVPDFADRRHIYRAKVFPVVIVDISVILVFFISGLYKDRACPRTYRYEEIAVVLHHIHLYQRKMTVTGCG